MDLTGLGVFLLLIATVFVIPFLLLVPVATGLARRRRAGRAAGWEVALGALAVLGNAGALAVMSLQMMDVPRFPGGLAAFLLLLDGAGVLGMAALALRWRRAPETGGAAGLLAGGLAALLVTLGGLLFMDLNSPLSPAWRDTVRAVEAGGASSVLAWAAMLGVVAWAVARWWRPSTRP